MDKAAVGDEQTVNALLFALRFIITATTVFPLYWMTCGEKHCCAVEEYPIRC